MSRRSRVVIPGCPHHVTQRGNNRRDVFFSDVGRETYIKLLRRYCTEYEVGVVGYCLMSNHVHLIATPEHEKSLARAFGRAHNDYSRWLNVSRGESGHLWQSRFYSCALDRRHLWAALAYVERNPVRAAMVTAAEKWQWSSAGAHLNACGPNEWLDRGVWQENWSAESWGLALSQGLDEGSMQVRLTEATRNGMPLGDEAFLRLCERESGRQLEPQKRGPKAKSTRTDVLALGATNLE